MATLNIPLPEAPPGGFYGGMRAANALTQQNLVNQIYQAQAKYAEQNALADAMSKAAYAAFVGPQTLGKLISDPALRGLIPKDMLPGLVQSFASQSQNFNNMMQNLPKPGGGGGVFGALGHALRNLLHIPPASAQPMNAFSQPSSFQPQQPSEPQGTSADLPGGFGQQNRMSDEELERKIKAIQDKYDQEQSGVMTAPATPQGEQTPTPASSTSYSTPAAVQTQSLIPTGATGAESPTAASQRGEEAAKTALIGQTQAQTEQWKERENDAAAAAKDAASLSNLAQSFHNTYPNAYYTGARLGSLPSKGLLAPPGYLTKTGDLSHEQKLDLFANNMQAQQAKMLGANKLTNMELTFSGNLKLARPLDKEAENDVYNSLESTAKRIRDRQKFYNAIRRSDPSVGANEADILWDMYNEDFPPYDLKTFKPLPKNNEKWKEYSTKNAVNQLRTNHEFHINKKSKHNENIYPTKTIGNKTYYLVNGKWSIKK